MADAQRWRLFFTADDPEAWRNCENWLLTINTEVELLARKTAAVFWEQTGTQDEVKALASSATQLLEQFKSTCECLVPDYRTPIELATRDVAIVLESLNSGSLGIMYEPYDRGPARLVQEILGDTASRGLGSIGKDAIDRLQHSVGTALGDLNKSRFIPAAPDSRQARRSQTKWSKLLEVFDELKKSNPKCSHKEIVAEYNRRHGGKNGCPKADIPKLRKAIENRKAAKRRTTGSAV